uniref:U6 snRNA-associated Sm-like protein LSm1 n=1 Tax=Picocystis salinarum TaxID=88271 RepID=A0A7S3UC68_9CHLO|mmetsp:Transcript_452/g.3373  ORF Transcript_452/g.3373 Transcript_452/m.3373 type:complete len:227 (+) Transcript_452:201-881(+)
MDATSTLRSPFLLRRRATNNPSVDRMQHGAVSTKKLDWMTVRRRQARLVRHGHPYAIPIDERKARPVEPIDLIGRIPTEKEIDEGSNDETLTKRVIEAMETREQLPRQLQLPPMLEELDKKVLVNLRDGRVIVGVLRSFDQFANVVLENAYERIIVEDVYGDIPLGVYVIRGENVVIMGEVNLAKEVPTALRRVSAPEIQQAKRAEKAADGLKETMRKRFDFLDLE